MRRYHSKNSQRIRSRRARERKRFYPDRTPYDRLDQLLGPAPRWTSHNLSKRKPGDCGNARCYRCHSDKLLGNVDVQRKRNLGRSRRQRMTEINVTLCGIATSDCGIKTDNA